MCGILFSKGINEGTFKEALEKQSHRGPDHTDFIKTRDILVGHNRLSIQDVSENSNQPMCKDNYILTFNGELYNAPELRLFLKKKEFVATIKIENNCQLDTSYFIVRNLDTGHFASFNNGIAKLKVFKNAPLQLQLSPSVKYISFEGVAVAASKNVTITADCRERTLDMIKNDK